MPVNIEVRNRILGVARKMFFNFGIKKVTVDEIAADLGIGKATLYEHFPSKSILVQAVIEEKRLEMESYLSEIHHRIVTKTELNIIQLIKELIIFGSNELSEMKEPFLREVNRSFTQFSLEMYYYDHLREIIDEMLARGIQKKVIRDDFNTQVFTEMLFGILNMTISNEEFANRFSVTRAEVMDTIVKVIVGGVLTDTGRREYAADMPGGGSRADSS